MEWEPSHIVFASHVKNFGFDSEGVKGETVIVGEGINGVV